MRIYLDIDTRRLMSSPVRPLSVLEFKRRDNDTIELVFLRQGIAQELTEGTIAKIGIKLNAEYASEFLALAMLTQSGYGADTVYVGDLNFNTPSMATAFADEPETVDAMLEIEWISGSTLSSSRTLPVTISNDVIRGDEGSPAALPLFYTSVTSDFQATQAQAEAGTDNMTWMSPLRTAQAIAALGDSGGVSSWNDLTDVPTEFAPEAHTHSLADITDSGATPGQVATWNGTTWAPQSTTGGGVTSYNDLTDVPSTFAPSPHTHTIAETTGLQSALDAKQVSGSYIAASGFNTIAVVDSLPSTPDPSTIYIVTA